MIMAVRVGGTGPCWWRYLSLLVEVPVPAAEGSSWWGSPLVGTPAGGGTGCCFLVGVPTGGVPCW